ncbi:unnamed protein product [Amoebophrya sp. A25]|nr:unnamed protein product [Amoebophrya sp. A25]|eukprot:GSA25T00019072001.1
MSSLTKQHGTRGDAMLSSSRPDRQVDHTNMVDHQNQIHGNYHNKEVDVVVDHLDENSASFVRTERLLGLEKDRVEQMFLRDLSTSRAPIHRTLVDLIQDSRHRLKVFAHRVIFPPEEQLPPAHYVMMVRGNADFELKKLGEKYGFPRGFPLVYRPGGGSVGLGWEGEDLPDLISEEEVSTPASGLKGKKEKKQAKTNKISSKNQQASSSKKASSPGSGGANAEDLAEIVSYGFYPKFDNDTALPKVRLEDYANAERVTFFRKWSGFLSMIVAFQVGKRSFWTATSKNSCAWDSDFVQDAARLWTKVVTPALVARMAKDKLCLCAETMSFNDQAHGARVLLESVIVTSLGIGTGSSSAETSGSGGPTTLYYGPGPTLHGNASVATLPPPTALTMVEEGMNPENDVNNARVVANGNGKMTEHLHLGQETEALSSASASSSSPSALVGTAEQGSPDSIPAGTEDSSQFVRYADLTELSTFCQEYALPHDPPVVLNGKEAIQQFLNAVNNARDYLTEEKLGQILKAFSLPFKSLHTQILGDVLEGLVLHCFSPAASSSGNSSSSSASATQTGAQSTAMLKKQTIKYKFPNYTCRTFGLRTILGEKIALDSPKALAEYRSYTQRWCYSEAGRSFWLSFLCACGMNLHARQFATKTSSGGLNTGHQDGRQDEQNPMSSSASFSSPSDDLRVGLHIRLADDTRDALLASGAMRYEEGGIDLTKFPEGKFDVERLKSSKLFPGTAAVPSNDVSSSSASALLGAAKSSAVADAFAQQASYDGTMICVLAPIGYGKSGFAEFLVAELNKREGMEDDRYVHIDGDTLFYGDGSGNTPAAQHEETSTPEVDVCSNWRSRTLSLGAERGCYTMWCILLALHMGKIPVISTGGGVLFGRKGHFALAEQIRLCFPECRKRVKLIACVPGNRLQNQKNLQDGTEDINYEIDLNCYNDLQTVQNTVAYRVQKGLWSVAGSQKLDQFQRMIAGKSQQNEQFAQQISDLADASFAFPRMRPGSTYKTTPNSTSRPKKHISRAEMSEQFGVDDSIVVSDHEEVTLSDREEIQPDTSATTVDVTSLVTQIQQAIAPMQRSAFSEMRLLQTRVLAEVPDAKCGHITMHYGYSMVKHHKAATGGSPVSLLKEDSNMVTRMRYSGQTFAVSLAYARAKPTYVYALRVTAKPNNGVNKVDSVCCVVIPASTAQWKIVKKVYNGLEKIMDAVTDEKLEDVANSWKKVLNSTSTTRALSPAGLPSSSSAVQPVTSSSSSSRRPLNYSPTTADLGLRDYLRTYSTRSVLDRLSGVATKCCSSADGNTQLSRAGLGVPGGPSSAPSRLLLDTTASTQRTASIRTEWDDGEQESEELPRLSAFLVSQHEQSQQEPQQEPPEHQSLNIKNETGEEAMLLRKMLAMDLFRHSPSTGDERRNEGEESSPCLTTAYDTKGASACSDGTLSLHVTVNPGRHAAKEMRTLAGAFLRGEPYVRLPLQNGKEFLDMNLANSRRELVKVRLCGLFGLPSYI